MVNHHVMWLDVSVHDALGMAIVQSLWITRSARRSLAVQGESAHFEKFEHVISNIVICEPRVEHFEIDIMDVFCDQAWDLGSRIANHVQQGYDIWTSCQVLENFDFSLDLLLLNGFEDFNDTLFVVDDVNTLEDLFDVNCWYENTIMWSGDYQGLRSPLNTFPVLLSELSRSGLEIPTGPVDCLWRRDQRQE